MKDEFKPTEPKRGCIYSIAILIALFLLLPTLF